MQTALLVGCLILGPLGIYLAWRLRRQRLAKPADRADPEWSWVSEDLRCEQERANREWVAWSAPTRGT